MRDSGPRSNRRIFPRCSRASAESVFELGVPAPPPRLHLGDSDRSKGEQRDLSYAVSAPRGETQNKILNTIPGVVTYDGCALAS